MRPIPLTRRNHLLHITSTLEANGISAERVLNQAKLPMWLYGDPEDLIPLRHVMVAIDAGARAMGFERFGLLVGESNPYDRFATFGKLITRSLTVYDALQNMCKFVRLQLSVSRMWLCEVDNTLWFCRGQLEGIEVEQRQMEQYALIESIRLVRIGAGPNWQPTEVHLCTPGAPRLEQTGSLSNAHIRYGQPFTAFSIPRSVLSLPVNQTGSRDTSNDGTVQERLRSTAPADDFQGSLGQLVQAMMSEGVPDLETAAEIADLSVRTLQRRLAQEGTTYKGVVDRARHRIAIGLLEDCSAKITDIAYGAGYGNLPHFTRAFRRWTGVTPSDYRRDRLLDEMGAGA